MEIQGGKVLSREPALLRVLPDHLHAYWPRIKPGIEAIKERCPKEPWITEDVYAALRAGWAQLHIGESGFLVTQDLVEDYTRRPILHVWLAYSKGGELAMGTLYLKTISNGRPIRFHSPRTGWEKFAKRLRTEYEL